jgi:hypothetical protein
MSRPFSASQEVSVERLEERIERQKEIVTEFRAMMERVQVQLNEIHRDLSGTLRTQGEEVAALKLLVHGPPSQPEAGLLSQIGVLRGRADVNDRRWERVIGYVLGAGAAGGGVGALLHSFLTAVR